MNEHYISVPRTGRYFSLGALEDARDLWIVCHGYGQLAARFLERFRPLAAAGEGRCIVAPEGLSRFYLSESPAERRVGASWMTREDRLHEIDDYVRYLDAVYREVARRGVKLTALGFSQGTATVCRWRAFGSSRIDRLILWGGEVPPDLDVARLEAANLTLVYGSRDEFFTPKIVGATQARLREHGIGFESVSFEGGHEIHEPTLRRLAGAGIEGVA